MIEPRMVACSVRTVEHSMCSAAVDFSQNILAAISHETPPALFDELKASSF